MDGNKSYGSDDFRHVLIIIILLIYAYQAIGTAISTLVTQSIVTILLIILAFNEIDIKVAIAPILIIGYVFLAIIIPYLMSRTPLDWKIQLITSVFCTFIVGILLKMLPIKSFYQDLMTKKDS